MPYHTYILFFPGRNKYYIGHTGDVLQERLRKHNTQHRGFTGGSGDWVIVYFKTFTTKTAAYKRELEIKAWKSRKRLEELING